MSWESGQAGVLYFKDPVDVIEAVAQGADS